MVTIRAKHVSETKTKVILNIRILVNGKWKHETIRLSKKKAEFSAETAQISESQFIKIESKFRGIIERANCSDPEKEPST